jgi:hypothetical protein
MEIYARLRGRNSESAHARDGGISLAPAFRPVIVNDIRGPVFQTASGKCGKPLKRLFYGSCREHRPEGAELIKVINPRIDALILATRFRHADVRTEDD